MAGYGDDAGLQAWLDKNGHVLPVGAPSPAILRERGSSWVDSAFGAQFTGVPTDGVAQEREWPRSGATAYGSALASDLVPARIVTASYMAAWIEAQKPGRLSVVIDPAKRVKHQKVDTVEREFFEPGRGQDATGIVSPEINGLLAPLLKQDTATSVGLGIWSVG